MNSDLLTSAAAQSVLVEPWVAILLGGFAGALFGAMVNIGLEVFRQRRADVLDRRDRYIAYIGASEALWWFMNGEMNSLWDERQALRETSRDHDSTWSEPDFPPSPMPDDRAYRDAYHRALRGPKHDTMEALDRHRRELDAAIAAFRRLRGKIGPALDPDGKTWSDKHGSRLFDARVELYRLLDRDSGFPPAGPVHDEAPTTWLGRRLDSVKQWWDGIQGR